MALSRRPGPGLNRRSHFAEAAGKQASPPGVRKESVEMQEVFRTNDPVKLSYVRHLLNEAGIDFFVADEHMSAVEGNIGAFPRRVLVAEPLLARARLALLEVEPG